MSHIFRSQQKLVTGKSGYKTGGWGDDGYEFSLTRRKPKQNKHWLILSHKQRTKISKRKSQPSRDQQLECRKQANTRGKPRSGFCSKGFLGPTKLTSHLPTLGSIFANKDNFQLLIFQNCDLKFCYR